MTKKIVTSLALAAGCAIVLAVPAAQAQVRSSWGENPALNNAESAQYDRLLETSQSFRQSRISRECGPIADPQLRQKCLASFAQYEPSMGSSGRTMASRTRSYRSTATGYNAQEGMTGSSDGAMTSTTGYGSEAYGAGYGSSANSANYGTARNSFGASRNLPAEESGGMIQSNGAMPNYPGPRPSGPLSGGGGR